QKRMPGWSTGMQVLKRPPEPNESPEPTKVTVVDMGVGFLAANDAHSRSPPVSLSQRRTKLTMKPVDGHDQDPAAAKLAIQCPRRSGQYYRRDDRHGSTHRPSICRQRHVTFWGGGRAARLRSLSATRSSSEHAMPELGAGGSSARE